MENKTPSELAHEAMQRTSPGQLYDSFLRAYTKIAELTRASENDVKELRRDIEEIVGGEMSWYDVIAKIEGWKTELVELKLAKERLVNAVQLARKHRLASIFPVVDRHHFANAEEAWSTCNRAGDLSEPEEKT